MLHATDSWNFSRILHKLLENKRWQRIRLWHPNYKSIYSMSQTCFSQLFSIIPCEHSKNKQTSFEFLGFCSRLPESKTKLVGKTQNQLSLHCRKIIKYDIDNLDL